MWQSHGCLLFSFSFSVFVFPPLLSGCDLSEAPTGQFPFQGDQKAQIGGRATGLLSARYRLHSSAILCLFPLSLSFWWHFCFLCRSLAHAVTSVSPDRGVTCLSLLWSLSFMKPQLFGNRWVWAWCQQWGKVFLQLSIHTHVVPLTTGGPPSDPPMSPLEFTKPLQTHTPIWLLQKAWW